MLDKYEIKPIFGIIPENQDPQLLKYKRDADFWDTVSTWIQKGYTPALHSDTHVYCSNCSGINPVNQKSEFAGLPLEAQCEKVRCGNSILLERNIHAEIFFALAHTFDENTVEALRRETEIRVISDTVATDVYFRDGFYYIPQQAGSARKMPFRTVTFCYHPNTMKDDDFDKFEAFLAQHTNRFTSDSELVLRKRPFGIQDLVIKSLYFGMRKLRKLR